MRQGLGVKATASGKLGNGLKKGFAQDAAAGRSVVASKHSFRSRMGGHQIKDSGRGRIEVAQGVASAPLCTAHMPA